MAISAEAMYAKIANTDVPSTLPNDKCLICGKSSCKYEGTTSDGETLESLNNSLILGIGHVGNPKEEARRLGMEKVLNWVSHQPKDALPPTDFYVPGDIFSSMSLIIDELQIGAEFTNFLQMNGSVPDEHHRAQTGNHQQAVRKNKRGRFTPVECQFCRSNGETVEYYTGHPLVVHGKVTCPILRRFVCPFCDATGDFAHTLKYCPIRNVICPSRKSYHPVKNAFGKMRARKY